MKKVMLAVVVLFAVGAGYLYVNSGLMVKYFIESSGSTATGVEVSIDSVELDILNGEATLYGLRVGNPDGYSDAAAFSVDVISVGLDAGSVGEPVMTINKIYVARPVLNFEIVDGVSNFEVIKQNAQSGQSEEDAPADDSGDVQKFIVKLIEFTDGEVTATGLAPDNPDRNVVKATMPGFKVTNIGKAEGGVPATTVAARITAAVTTRVIETVVAGSVIDIIGEKLGGLKDRLPLFGSSDDEGEPSQ